MNSKMWIAVAATAVMAAAGFYVSVLDEGSSWMAKPSPDSDASKISEMQGAEKDAPALSIRGASGSRPAFPLPPLDAPMSAVAADLRERAAHGDARAACRFAVELNRCAGLPDLREIADQLVSQSAKASHADGSVAADAALVARIEGSMRKAEVVCRNFSPQETDEAWRLLLDAANRGHLPSMLRFAIQPPLSEQRFAEQARGWESYKTNAGRLLHAAAERGSPEAANFLAAAYYGVPMPGGATIVERNASNALTYALVAQASATDNSKRALDRMISKLEAKLTFAEQESARRAASKLLADSVSNGRRAVDFLANVIPEDPSDCEQR